MGQVSDGEYTRRRLVWLVRRIPLAWRRRAAIAIGGALGTGLRIGVAAAFPLTSWPWATFVENLSGAFVLGFLLTRLLAAAPRTTLSVPLLCTGLLGSYTTFSTFVVEAVRLGEVGTPLTAKTYVVVSITLGLLAARLGTLAAARRP